MNSYRVEGLIVESVFHSFPSLVSQLLTGMMSHSPLLCLERSAAGRHVLVDVVVCVCDWV